VNERILVAMISAASFLIIAFTPIVPLFLYYYDINNVYIIKAVIGLLSLLCGYGIIWGLFKKEGEIKQKKEGKIRIKPILAIAGIIIICIA